MRSGRGGYTIFCDDIRQEVGNKSSLMGVYGPDLIVEGDFPVTMSKLGFFIKYKEDLGVTPEKMALNIFLPGDSDDKPTYTIDVERADSGTSVPLPDATPDTKQTMALNIVFSPVILKNEGRIKVRMQVGDEEVKLGTLKITRRKLEEAVELVAK
jgi:hypothetical protein